MTIKSFIIAAATGLSLLAALPASAHHNATPKAQTVKHNQRGDVARQYYPLREIFRMIRRMERQEWRPRHGRRHYRQYRRYRHHGSRNNRRYY